MPRLLDAFRVEEWGRPHVAVFMGKGGVGKTTSSLRVAVEAAEQGWRVLLASLDPAGHLLEYLGLPRPLVEREVAPGLRAVQYSVEEVAKRVAEEYAVLLRRLVPGVEALSGLDLERAVRDAPGFEEEVFLRILQQLYGRRDADLVVVDMPPTGVALRVVALPRLHLFWAQRLREIRERIVSIKYAIANAMGRRAEVDDPVLRKLDEIRERNQRLYDEMRNPARTSFAAVATPEPLPVYEVQVIAEKLMEHGMRLEAIIANRVLGEKAKELGTADIEEESLRRLEETRCRLSPPPGLVLIAHAPRPPSRLEDVKQLGNYILEVRRECRHR